jgi:glycosyltransferase involved in cell wall biosynthesis
MKPTKLLMLGWEFPPLHSGGLGVATKNLAMALSDQGVPICFALPHFAFKKWKEKGGNSLELEVSSHNPNVEFFRINSSIKGPYITEESYQEIYKEIHPLSDEKHLYGDNLFDEVERYAIEMEHFSKKREFGLIHAHDWMTFPAATRIKKQQDTPYVAHVHATEIDRTGARNLNEEIFRKEREGLEAADTIITVSDYTKRILKKHYGLRHKNIHVVHNGAEEANTSFSKEFPRFSQKKTVLFLGRLTLQKGPDWFVKIAKKVLEKEKNIQFLIAGTGHMLPELLHEISRSGLNRHIIPLGFLDEEYREKVFSLSDVYVMPSVSEPFGLSAIESAQRGVPVILSKQSGVREVLGNSLVADFWDVEKMAHFILSALYYPSLYRTLSQKAKYEIKHLTWKKQAKKVHRAYRDLSSAF